MDDQVIIEIKDVSFRYDDSYVLENINFKIYKNDFIGIIGPNGGGKTTLLRLILGFLPNQKGKIKINGIDNLKMRKKIGYVPQYSTMDKDFPISVEEVVAMGFFKWTDIMPVISKRRKGKIQDILKKLKIESIATQRFGDLSGGQKQRCLIARALINDPEILILDEPTASVDVNIESDIYELLKDLNQKMTILLVSHDVSFVSKYVNRVFCLNRNIACHEKNEISSTGSIYSENIDEIHHKCGL